MSFRPPGEIHPVTEYVHDRPYSQTAAWKDFSSQGSVEMTRPEPKNPRLPMGMLLHLAITPNRGIIIQPPVTHRGYGDDLGVHWSICMGPGH